jgi:hypothetical protein
MSKYSKDTLNNCVTHRAYRPSRGAGPDEPQRMECLSKPVWGNRASQLILSNAAYSTSRGKSHEQPTSSNPSSAKAEWSYRRWPNRRSPPGSSGVTGGLS